MMRGTSWHIAGGALVLFGCFTLQSVLEQANVARDTDVVELWSGVGAVVAAAGNLGFETRAFDLHRVPGVTNRAGAENEDITKKSGFGIALKHVLSLRPGGLLWMAPLCSSFVFPNNSNTKRTKANFAGDESYKPVAEGNLMAMICVFFAQLALARCVHVGFENLVGSTIWSYCRMWCKVLDLLECKTIGRCAYDEGPFPRLGKI